jgi:hypothetical protein
VALYPTCVEWVCAGLSRILLLSLLPLLVHHARFRG